MNSITHVVVPGTFDPVTNGHLDVIRRASRLFENVTVAVAASKRKHGTGTTFSLEERVQMLKDALVDEGLVDVSVEPMEGGVVKGLRAMTDFEYELQQADLNSHMAPELESIFVMSSPEYGYISSSIVREISAMGADVSFLVPKNVIKKLEALHNCGN